MSDKTCSKHSPGFSNGCLECRLAAALKREREAADKLQELQSRVDSLDAVIVKVREATRPPRVSGGGGTLDQYTQGRSKAMHEIRMLLKDALSPTTSEGKP